MVCSNTIIYIVVSEKEKIFERDEKEKWEIINENYMTEENDDSSGESFRQHSLTWRSESTLI